MEFLKKLLEDFLLQSMENKLKESLEEVSLIQMFCTYGDANNLKTQLACVVAAQLGDMIMIWTVLDKPPAALQCQARGLPST